MVAACPLLVFNADQEQSLVSEHFDRFMDYQFENGEKMRIHHKGLGLEQDAVHFEMQFSGHTPLLHLQRYAWVDNATEELTEEEPGLIRGAGHAVLHVGNEAQIPF
ncbi:unnamed protein product [Gongylonema pulchrum]|uniref:Nidogen G2 beta-barrel domain-containing protein n=1 Tax=Gongylonema pulchrum TaxID=637853 RepID=A0A183DD37_9BILA|nr:unnamed protein product [Gongylonema pulchrum]